MKRLIFLFTALVWVIQAGAQLMDTNHINIGKKHMVTVTESDSATNVQVKDDLMVVNETEDTIKIKLGNKAIRIIEDGNKTDIEIIEKEDFEKHGWKERPRRFKGHWSGFDVGMNNFVEPDWNLAGSDPGTGYLDLNTGKSWELDLNFMQYSLPMGRHLGWVTGMGFKWNEYRFDRNNSITKDSDDLITPLYPPPGATAFDKSKLNTTYLTVPLLLEMQFGEKGRGYFSAGVIGDLKLTSKTKVKYFYNGSSQKEKVRNDFNLSPLRCHLTARMGYRFIRLFATYSLVPLFKNNTGPTVYPVTVGLTLINFR